MSIRVALNHRTHYTYDRPVSLGPQVIRLRPAVHSRTPIDSYSLTVKPDGHFLNWQQDPYGNFLARCVFSEPTTEFSIEVDLVANMTTINPFDFFLEPQATDYPFDYSTGNIHDLGPYLAEVPVGPKFEKILADVDRTPRRTIDFLVDLNQTVQNHVGYIVRMEPGVQTPEQTLELGSGSCRDSAWLLVALLRRLGFAARFVSGYLIQLVADQKPLDGPEGPVADFTDLHAWTEVFLPGAGWVGLDPTSGLLTGEGHIPLACTPEPTSAAPISGGVSQAEVEFGFSMSVSRIFEDPRVTKPYTEEQWERIEKLGHVVDEHLKNHDCRLTMGGEPTFVAIDDQDGDEWNTAAVGPTKRKLGHELMERLKQRFSTGGLLHNGQGKWYPGEPLPRWAFQCFWRKDGEPIWENEELFAKEGVNYGHTADDADRFAKALAARLGVNPEHAINGYEDVFYYAWRERRLPADVDLSDSKLESKEERTRFAKVVEQGLTAPVGVALPLQFGWWNQQPAWRSGKWVVRSDEMFLLPGDSPMGYRLPLESLLYEGGSADSPRHYELDQMNAVEELPTRSELQRQTAFDSVSSGGVTATNRLSQAQTPAQLRQLVGVGSGDAAPGSDVRPGDSNGHQQPVGRENGQHSSPGDGRAGSSQFDDEVIRTALCIEPRDGKLHLFLPPLDRLEPFLDLIASIEDTAAELDLPVVLEGYLPPRDSRIEHIKVTPDPGVLEVNVHPANDWNELVEITQGVYDEARQTRLGTEKFDTDGSHTGTGGGNHVVLGGPTVADSPFLRRPDLLKSLVGYWQNHPSLSYLFSGKFIGPTSQAPRVDETRGDAISELRIAFEQIKSGREYPSWLVDRVFRHLLVDLTGNTHRAEFCIDKLFSPDTATGRLGLVEFRAFEMPPHARMSLTQQLLLRSMVVRFWEQPYEVPLVDWDTSLHDRFMLPHFVWRDFEDVIDDCRRSGFPLEKEWFAAHQEFRFPRLGEFSQRDVHVELRKAIEPWYVLGEEPAGGATARYVDSSNERMQVKLRGMTDGRHILTCNGRRVPLHPTGTEGEYVAGIRYRAYQPPSCLHPTIPATGPLVFDLIDTWNGRSIGGGRYYVGHPGGLNPDSFPINALEAESRRGTRFHNFGHTGGAVEIPPVEANPDYPMTLDLRREAIR
ncbi:transglutaminase family protein [Stratiformator vulcanicus]|uniref:Transglutaminase-like domain-containing protein n=1 Tax=Stratiformator vulcanicus TaxID=2527980 RepID=A0A517QX38_9PLAN|nr:transglutaminase family protein [Stratiformator vulcanicus]QDT36201.1 hypothetical protein Pan189_05560 [Stratiformator vulcanicus]